MKRRVVVSILLCCLSCSGKLGGSASPLRSSPTPSSSSGPSSSSPSSSAGSRGSPSSRAAEAPDDNSEAARAERAREYKQKQADQEAAHWESQIKKSCTFPSGLSAQCAEVERKTLPAFRKGAPSPEGLETIAGCYRDAQNATRSKTPPGTGSAAGLLIEEGRQDEPAAAECLRLIDEGTASRKWRAPHEERFARRKYIFEIAQHIDSDFMKKCGMSARIDDKTSGGINLVVERNSRNKKVFHTGKSPDGETHTILCNGQVTTKSPRGGSRVSQPTTEADRGQEGQDLACMQSCARSNLSCSANPNITAEPCRSACKAVCEK